MFQEEHRKGAPAIECRTYSRLVSPGLDPKKKKNWRASQIAFKMAIEHCIDSYKVLYCLSSFCAGVCLLKRKPVQVFRHHVSFYSP